MGGMNKTFIASGLSALAISGALAVPALMPSSPAHTQAAEHCVETYAIVVLRRPIPGGEYCVPV